LPFPSSLNVELWNNNLGNSVQIITIFKAHKKVIRVMMGCRSRNLCTDLFKILNILPLKSQYMFSLLIFVVHNKTTLKLMQIIIYLPVKEIMFVLQAMLFYMGMRVFENMVLRRIFGPKRDKVTGEWRKLHNDELNEVGGVCSMYG
jgi:hypothetical protein